MKMQSIFIFCPAGRILAFAKTQQRGCVSPKEHILQLGSQLIHQTIGWVKRKIDDLVGDAAVVNPQKQVEFCKGLLEMRRMDLALVVQPIKNGFGKVALRDDILFTIVQRTAFITPFMG